MVKDTKDTTWFEEGLNNYIELKETFHIQELNTHTVLTYTTLEDINRNRVDTMVISLIGSSDFLRSERLKHTVSYSNKKDINIYGWIIAKDNEVC